MISPTIDSSLWGLLLWDLPSGGLSLITSLFLKKRHIGLLLWLLSTLGEKHSSCPWLKSSMDFTSSGWTYLAAFMMLSFCLQFSILAIIGLGLAFTLDSSGRMKNSFILINSMCTVNLCLFFNLKRCLYLIVTEFLRLIPCLTWLTFLAFLKAQCHSICLDFPGTRFGRTKRLWPLIEILNGRPPLMCLPPPTLLLLECLQCSLRNIKVLRWCHKFYFWLHFISFFIWPVNNCTADRTLSSWTARSFPLSQS